MICGHVEVSRVAILDAGGSERRISRRPRWIQITLGSVVAVVVAQQLCAVAGGIQGGNLQAAVYGGVSEAVTGGVLAGIGDVLGNPSVSQANDWNAPDGELGGGPSTPASVKMPPIYPAPLTIVAGTRALGHFPVESPFRGRI